MKTLCRVAIAAAFTTGALAQYDIKWQKIAGGGGTSTNGLYSLSGTIGQPDASGPMTNGTYSLTGGFWVLPTAVQTPGVPVLSIVLAAPGYATISWNPNTPGYTLQANLTLLPGGWAPAPSGTTNPVVVPATGAAKFYRLTKS